MDVILMLIWGLLVAWAASTATPDEQARSRRAASRGSARRPAEPTRRKAPTRRRG